MLPACIRNYQLLELDKTAAHLLAALVLCAFVALPVCAQGTAAAAWKNAKKVGTSWSREALPDKLLAQYRLDKMHHSEFLSLYGEPDRSVERLDSTGWPSNYSDDYMLSSNNKKSLSVVYEYDVLKGTGVNGPIVYHIFLGPAPRGAKVLTTQALKKSLIDRYPGRTLYDLTVYRLKQILGPADFENENVNAVTTTLTLLAHQKPKARSSYYWRAAPDGRKYIVIDSEGKPEEPLGKRHVSQVSIVTLSQDCPTEAAQRRGPF